MKSVWVGLDDLIDALDKRTDIYRVVGPLERVHARVFAYSQAQVASPAHPHVPTYMPRGVLAASGHTRTYLRGTSAWYGEIIYDARNDQGDGYAIFEYNRGGIHAEFIDGCVRFEGEYKEAIRQWLRGD